MFETVLYSTLHNTLMTKDVTLLIINSKPEFNLKLKQAFGFCQWILSNSSIWRDDAGDITPKSSQVVSGFFSNSFFEASEAEWSK